MRHWQQFLFLHNSSHTNTYFGIFGGTVSNSNPRH